MKLQKEAEEEGEDDEEGDGEKTEHIDEEIVREAIERACAEWEKEHEAKRPTVDDDGEEISPEEQIEIDKAERAIFAQKDQEIDVKCAEIRARRDETVKEFA